MAVLSQSQWARLWIQAGGDPKEAGTASAIVMAESSGNSGATNHNTNGSTDLGGWQINNQAHPQYNQQELLSNPLYNAKAAVAISDNGKNWGPWVTFTTGAYKKFLSGYRGPSRSTVAVGKTTPTSPESTPSNPNPLSGLAAIGHLFSDLVEPQFWLRVGKVLAGGVIVIIAISRLSGIKAIPAPIPV